MARTKGGVFYPAIFGSLRENNGSTDSSRPRHDLASLNSLLGVTQREQYFTGSYGGMGSGRGRFIIASTPCFCVGIGDQHSGIVRLFEVV